MDHFFEFSQDPDNALILLHGFLGNRNEWLGIKEKLSSRVKCRILIPDLPGHGECRTKPDENIRLGNILDIPGGCRKIMIWGYSMGGRIAMMEACRYLSEKISEDRVKPELSGLIIESSNPGILTDVERRNRIAADEKWASEFESGPLIHTLKKWYDQPVFASMSDDKKALLIKEKSSGNPLFLAEALRCFSVGRQNNLENVFDLIPALYIYGEKDEKYAKIADRLSKNHNSLSVVKIMNGDHNLHRFHGDEMLKIIFKW